MKTSRGLRLLTAKEACTRIAWAADCWFAFMHHDPQFDWTFARQCLQHPASSPFILRTDDQHLLAIPFPDTNHILYAYKTLSAQRQIRLLKDAAIAEDHEQFSEHFYTALDL